ncbi:MAG: DMT family transporter [Thermoanaerobaculia bacterium]
MPEISGGVALALASALGWSLYDLERRFLAVRVPALALVAGMTAGTAVPLALWAVASGGLHCVGGYWLPATTSVVLNLAANFSYFQSLQISPISKTLPMLAFTPAFAALLAAIFLGERLPLRGVAGLALVVVGALLLTLAPGRGLRGLLSGIAEDRGCRLMIGVALLWSAALLLDKRALSLATPQLHALVLNGGVSLGAFVVLASRRQLSDIRRLRGSLGWLVLAIATGAAALASQLLALGTVPVGFLETVKRGVGGLLAVLWGRMLLAEPIRAGKLAAIALMTAGVALVVL